MSVQIIPYIPWEKSVPFHEAASDPNVDIAALITAASYGKTFALLNEAIRQVIQHGHGTEGTKTPYLVIVIEPTYRMIYDVAVPIWFQFFPECMIRSWSKSEGKLEAQNGAIVLFRSSEKIDRIRGTRPDLICLDELRDMNSYCLQLACSRVSFKRGKVLVATTPLGYDASYELIELPAQTDGRIKCFTATAYDNPLYSREALDRQADLLGDDLAAQEVYGQRVSFTGRVYRHFDEARHVGTVQYNAKYPVAMAVDFNVDPISAVLMHPLGRDGFQCFAEFTLRHSDTDELCRTILAKYPAHKSEWWVYPDPSGKASHTSNAGRSDHAILKEYFGPNCIKAHPRAPAIRDRVAALNRLFRAGYDGNSPTRFVVDPRCKTLIKGLSTLGWKGNIPDEQAFEGHITAAIGYAEEYERPFGLGGLRETQLKTAKQLRRDTYSDYET